MNARCWKCLSMVNYYISAMLLVFAIIGIGFGAFCSSGNLGKLMHNFYPVNIMCVGGGMAILAAFNFDSTRLFMPRAFYVYTVLLGGLLGLSMYLQSYESGTEELRSENRNGWVLLDPHTRRELQDDYECCGWSGVEDNAVMPCPTLYKESCDSALVWELDQRKDVQERVMQGMVGSQILAFLFALLYALFLRTRLSQSAQMQRSQWEKEQEEQKQALLERSEIWRKGTGV